MSDKISVNGLDIIQTLLAYIDCMEQEVQRSLPNVIDQSFMEKASPAEISLVKIRLMIYRCKQEMDET